MSDPSLFRSSEIGMTHTRRGSVASRRKTTIWAFALYQNGNRRNVRCQREWVDVDVTQVTSVESRSLSLASNDSLERSNFLGSLLKFSSRESTASYQEAGLPQKPMP